MRGDLRRRKEIPEENWGELQPGSLVRVRPFVEATNRRGGDIGGEDNTGAGTPNRSVSPISETPENIKNKSSNKLNTSNNKSSK